MSSLISLINLPFPIFLHALGLLVLGLALTFAPPPQGPPHFERDSSIIGISATAIALCYLTTAYMPLSENAVLYASAPVRVFLAFLAGLRILYGRMKWGNDRRAYRKELVWIMLYDGVGGVLLGWWLGTFSGRIPAYQNQ
jgi:hypothetical protein